MKDKKTIMKRMMTAAFCVLLMLFSLVLPAAAEEGKQYIFDEADMLGDSIEILNQEAEVISEQLGVQITFLGAATTNGPIEEHANAAYQEMFGDSDGIMLIISEEESLWLMLEFGALAEMVTEEDEKAMWDAFCQKDYYDECVTEYIKKSVEILVQKGYVMNTAGGTTGETQDEQTAEEAENVIPEERQLPRLVDEADLLTDEEERSLLKKLDEISERQECDVAVVTVNSLEGKTATAYADDFYDYNGYGYGKDDDGILLLISMEDRDWAITTYGYGITAFTDAGQGYMVDQFKPSLSNGNYEAAFTRFAELCDEFLTQAKTDKPYDVGNLPRGKVGWIWIPIDIVVGFVIALILALMKKSKLKTVVKKETANSYTVPGSIHLYLRTDSLYNKSVTCHTISTSSSSSRGGSSTHRSSSGRTHGGSSGKF